MSQFYLTVTNIIRTSYIANNTDRAALTDLQTFLETPFKLLNHFEIDMNYKTELHKCLRLFYLTSNFLKYELSEQYLQVHINYLMNFYEKLLRIIFEREKNVALVVSKIIKEDYMFFELLMEFLEQVKLLPSRLKTIQEVLNKYNVLAFVEKVINQIEFTIINGTYIMNIRNKYFSSLSNFKKFLDLINILLRNNVNFYVKIFTASSKEYRKTSILNFIILAHLQSSYRPVHYNTLIAINTLFYAFGSQFLDKTGQKTAIGEIFLDNIEKYDYIADINFFKLVEVLIVNEETCLLERFNERLGICETLIDHIETIKSKKRKILAIKIVHYYLQMSNVNLRPTKIIAFYDRMAHNLHKNVNSLFFSYIQPVLLIISQKYKPHMTLNIELGKFNTNNSKTISTKTTASS